MNGKVKEALEGVSEAWRYYFEVTGDPDVRKVGRKGEGMYPPLADAIHRIEAAHRELETQKYIEALERKNSELAHDLANAEQSKVLSRDLMKSFQEDHDTLNADRELCNQRGYQRSAKRPGLVFVQVIDDLLGEKKMLQQELARVQIEVEAERAKAPVAEVKSDSGMDAITKAAESIGIENVTATCIAKWIVMTNSELVTKQNTLCELRNGVTMAAIEKILAGQVVANETANAIASTAQEAVKEWLERHNELETELAVVGHMRAEKEIDANTTKAAAYARAWARTATRVRLELDAYGVPTDLGLDDRLRWLARKAGIDISDLQPTIAEFARYHNTHDSKTVPANMLPSLDALRKSAQKRSMKPGA